MRLNVNGQAHDVNVDPDMPLLWGLRDVLGLTGTKFGCGIAQCGACMVHIDGEPAFSCVTLVSAVGDSKITTIEGLAGPVAKAVQEAWARLDVPQCGYCRARDGLQAHRGRAEKLTLPRRPQPVAKADHRCEVRQRNRGRRPIGRASSHSRLIHQAVNKIRR